VVAGSGLPAWMLPRVPPRRRPPVVGPWPLRCYEGGATNVTTEEVAADDPASLAGLSGGVSFSTEAADDGDAVEPEVILGHPTLRAPRDVSLDEAMGTARWALTQA
jgi:hypothetical protein